ncbi:hypothetical protein [Aeromicrobium sp. 179-A 4D2 NHS]|uniref:hypothetical protein n=1 Tax=Aeromicrobium sp. 179-A 4D2 NHS TaxID=3142375 RepID=UPI0039A08052
MIATDNTPMLQALRDIATQAEEVWQSEGLLPVLRQYHETFTPDMVLRLIDLAEQVQSESHLSSMIAEQRGAKQAIDDLRAEARIDLDGPELAAVERICNRVTEMHHIAVPAS